MQAAALAEHLARSGVHWTPRPNLQNVAHLKDRFTVVATPAVVAAGLSPEMREPESPTQQPASPSIPQLKPLTQTPLAHSSSKYQGSSLGIAERKSRLSILQSEVAQCTKCPELVRCREHTVFGEGNPQARFMFFGEAPGADEDHSGRPFVGKAGQLLTKMIEACKLSREEVYIFNTIKCRPPNNRNPEPDEVANCRTYFEQQIQLIRPEYIVCLGAVSSQALLDNKLSVGRLRGSFHRYFDSKVLVTYHPSYLLRTPAAKKAAWEDLQLMMRDAGLR